MNLLSFDLGFKEELNVIFLPREISLFYDSSHLRKGKNFFVCFSKVPEPASHQSALLTQCKPPWQVNVTHTSIVCC